MIKLNYFGDEQIIYYEKMDNGLDVYVAPTKRNNYRIELAVKYGSSINEFIPVDEKEYLKLPLGVAHFLEHKMFDMENGDAFSFYSKTGTYINAGTNYFLTRYYIGGIKHLKKNLDYLLTMISTPFLKEDNVNNEKGIIEEEIKMYEDEVDWTLDHISKKNLFYTTVNEEVAGTSKSIKEITPDILNKTYNTFYQPSNMILVVTGNVKYQDIINIVKNNKAIKSKMTNKKIVYKKEKESVLVPREYQLINANLIIPKLAYSYKFDLDTFKKDYLYGKLYLNLIFTHLFGDTSRFNEKVIEKGLTTDFYIDYLSFDNIYSMTITAESEYADLFKEEVDKTLSDLNVSEEDFERIKKTWISIIVRSLDSKEALAYSIVNDLIKDGRIYDQKELIEKLNYHDLEDIIHKIDLSNKSFVLMVPKENK